MIKFIIDYSGGVPIYRQIIDQIRFGIASGQLKLGEQLPTVRIRFPKHTKNWKSERSWRHNKVLAHLSIKPNKSFRKKKRVTN